MTMMLKIRCLLLSVMTFMTAVAFGQQGEVKARLDSTHILIGDYLNVQLSVKAPTSVKVLFPAVQPWLPDSIEMIGVSKIDTLIENNMAAYKQTVTVTAFDSGSFVFPALPFYTNDSVLLGTTNPLPFEVTTVPVDTTLAIKDIHQPVKVPLTFKEVLPYILAVLAVALLVALIVFLVLRYAKREKKPKVKVKVVPKEKAHIIALSRLEALRKKKLWEVGEVKSYYSELTDIIRDYMENRWEFGAMEMVTPEIMTELERLNLFPEVRERMREILNTADLVKFAKWQPMPTDHDRCFKDAVDFVNATAEKTIVYDDNEKK